MSDSDNVNKNIKNSTREVPGYTTADDKFISTGTDNDFISSANNTRTFINVENDHSVRSEYNRADYEYYRPSERVPETPHGIMKACMKAYSKTGIIRNVVDLMSDFGCQGIQLKHKNKRMQKFWKKWFKKVNGKERSERFLNYLYRCGQVYIYRSYSKLTPKQVKDLRASAYDITYKDDPKVDKRQIPLRYTFMNPLKIEVVSPELCGFVDKPVLVMKSSSSAATTLSSIYDATKNDSLKEKVKERIPADLKDKLKNGYLDLDDDKIEVFYYKKDDWEPYAEPFTYSVMDDLITLQKMKLADLSALDGAISNIRLWTLGDKEKGVIPNAAAINKVRNIISNSPTGGVLDFVWDAYLDVKDLKSDIYKWLGGEKYVPVLNAIYEGLGIPPVLRSGGTGTTNTSSFLSMKTLVERLNYGRDRLIEFWEKEIRLVAKACGLSDLPEIQLDKLTLSDEVAMTQIALNMWDRDILPTETVVEMTGRDPEVQEYILRREARKRGKSNPYKASPYHNANFENEIKKILVQGGGNTASEVGVDLNNRKEGEQSRIEMQGDIQGKLESTKIKGQGGRPSNIVETTKRKPKPTEKPSSNAFLYYNNMLWATSAVNKISDIISPGYLEACGKKNLRQLTKEEVKELEDIRYLTLCNTNVGEYIDEESILDKVTKTISDKALQILDLIKNEYKATVKRELTSEETKHLQAVSYCMLNEE